MSENIKINEEDKYVFDMFQAELTLKAGKKITQQELFSKLIEFARSRKENFFGRIFKLPLSEKEMKKIKSLQTDWNVMTKETQIDKTLYGIEK